ncbi:MAG: PhnA domain-containing protein [Emcibacteraceae bacterium]|nr:PhnA domain-containing protein [Emcibacteraceae bacterium]
MTVLDALEIRAENKCELCTSDDNLNNFEVSPSDGTVDQSILLCDTCCDPQNTADDHFQCLSDSMWTPVPAVQVVAWRHLNRLSNHTWAQDLLDMLYLEDDVLAWAQDYDEEEEALKHLDSNGATLSAGDNVVLIKDLNVKGAGFTAKRGTAVRNISLDPNNEKHIEGRVEGQHIVILTEFVKKK